jgi:hypothetical protein
VLALGAFAPPTPGDSRQLSGLTPGDSRSARTALQPPSRFSHLSHSRHFWTHSRGSRISPNLIPGSLRTPRTHHRYQSDWVPILLRVPELSPFWYSFLLHTCLPRFSTSSATILLSFCIRTLVLMCYIPYHCSYASHLAIQSQSCT